MWLEITIHDVTTTMSHVQVEAIEKATREVQVLQLLIQQMMQGWSDHIKQLPEVLRPFWQIRNDLSIENSCVTFQGRFYIPSVVKIHSSVYWLGMNKEN